jgi:hypothetical protein
MADFTPFPFWEALSPLKRIASFISNLILHDELHRYSFTHYYHETNGANSKMTTPTCCDCP